MPVRRPSRRLAVCLAAALAAATGLLAGLLVAGPAPAAGHRTGIGTRAATAPSFLVASPARAGSLPTPRAMTGSSRPVTLRPDLLPERAAGQPISFDLGRRSVTGRVTHVEHHRDYTAWTGPLDVDLGTFVIVRSGPVYRASLTWPQAQWAVTRASGSTYWLTDVAPYAGPSGEDAVPVAPPAARRASPAMRPGAEQQDRRRHRTRVDVTFGYTKSAKLAAGGKAGLKAAVGQAAATTNLALANSGLKVEIRVKGIVKVKGQESDSVFTDLKRLGRARDGKFDGALKARSRHRADIVHLLTGGPSDRICGAGALPLKARWAIPRAGVSTSYVSCLPYIVATHEIGHNLGADHISYPGVSHQSRIKSAFGYYDVAHHFLTTMGYYDPCEDAGDYSCVRIPWFSTPKGSYGGFPIGSAQADNAKVIKKIAPRVARYSR